MTAPQSAFPREDVREIVATVVEIPVQAVVWDHEPLPYLAQIGGRPGYWIELSVTSTEGLGIDDQRKQFDEVKEVNALVQYGNRISVVRAKVTANDPDVPSFDIVERLRRRLRSKTAKELMQAADMALVGFEASVDLPREADNRTQTISTLDITFAWIVVEDPLDDDGNFIEEAPVTGTLTP